MFLEGRHGGSLCIYAVNNEPHFEIIYGTPKLAYPYKDFEEFEYVLPNSDSVYIANKWNGMNLMVFKYHNAKGEVFYSAKSKGIPFIKNGNYGNFLDLSCDALGWTIGETDYVNLESLSYLKDPKAVSITFELCGKKEPHLVNYSFDLDAKPLFITYEGGTIKPIITNDELSLGPLPYVEKDIIALCRDLQKVDEEANENYRKENGMTRKYEYNHFIREGRVLYCLDADGFLLNRTMYKIKPHDIEEVHWGRFDEVLEGRVDEVLKKIEERELKCNAATIQDELDMGEKEWGRYGNDIMAYVRKKGINVPN